MSLSPSLVSDMAGPHGSDALIPPHQTFKDLAHIRPHLNHLVSHFHYLVYIQTTNELYYKILL